jgi:hypothetical protein
VARTWLPRGSVELLIHASPERVYDAIADVTAVGGRSLECRRCDWLPGSKPGSVGARFRSRSRASLVARWSRVCEVTVVLLSHHRDMRPHMAYTLAALRDELASEELA